MKYGAIFYLLGRLLCLIGGLMLLPAAVSFSYGEQTSFYCFILTAAGTFLLGLLFIFICRKSKEKGIGMRDGFLLVTLSWVSISLLGALPYFCSGTMPHLADAIFESTSGFTTTGATILIDIEALPRGMLLWRGFTQYIGGLGIIVLAVAILPQLSVGGMQLMKNEMPGPNFEQLKPRIRATALAMSKIYILFSLLLLILLYLAGMSVFESVCHMFSTIASGGFSTRNASMAAFGVPIQIIVTFFMFLAGINFVLHYAWLHGDFKKLFRDVEWRFFSAYNGPNQCLLRQFDFL